MACALAASAEMLRSMPVTEDAPPELLHVLERYYDAAPRPSATTEEVGPFTLFLRSDPDGWPFYARPRIGLAVDVTADDVRRVRERQRDLGVPETFEWVHQTTPSLLPAARAAGVEVRKCPLLVLAPDPGVRSGLPRPTGAGAVVHTEVLAADAADLPLVWGAVHAGFAGTDEVAPRPVDRIRRLVGAGTMVVAAAYGEDGKVLGGGSHNPRGGTTELTGIAVLPSARRRGVGAALTAALVEDARARGAGTVFLSAQDDAVARVYERVGFERVGSACIGEAS